MDEPVAEFAPYFHRSVLIDMAHEMDMSVVELVDALHDQLDDHQWDGGMMDLPGICDELNLPEDQHTEAGLAAALAALPLLD